MMPIYSGSLLRVLVEAGQGLNWLWTSQLMKMTGFMTRMISRLLSAGNMMITIRASK